MSKYHGGKMQPRLIYKGAEAEIYLQDWFGELAVRKTRAPKPYRIRSLDDGIRRARTSHEAIMMHEVKKMGVAVPALLHIDTSAWTIVMEYVDAPTMKEELYLLPESKKQGWCNTLGRSLAEMHAGGVVHGDMTLSNVLCDSEIVCLVDFGLASFSSENEDRGVDLFLFDRALRSSYYSDHKPLFNSFLKGYSTSFGGQSKAIMNKMREIERRGRYQERIN